jgi:hypothetical protein
MVLTCLTLISQVLTLISTQSLNFAHSKTGILNNSLNLQDKSILIWLVELIELDLHVINLYNSNISSFDFVSYSVGSDSYSKFVKRPLENGHLE